MSTLWPRSLWFCGPLVLSALAACAEAPATQSLPAQSSQAASPGPALYKPLADAGTAPDANTGLPAQADLRCQADPAIPQRIDYAQPGPYQASTLELTFDDAARPIAATDKHPAAPARSLVTTIYYPSRSGLLQPARIADGHPFPMLMYSHGYSSTRSEAEPVAKQLASYGYIVVAPDFPLTNMLANDGAPDIEDTANQPGDVSFLIDQLLALSKDPDHVLADAIDETRIGALGVSLGGLTTLLVTFHPQLHDARIRAALPIAAPSSFFAQGYFQTREVPVLLLHGDLDAFLEYERNARRSLMRATGRARLVTVAKGSHAAFGAQMDAATTALLNSLLAPAGADPSNPDGLGCGAVGATLQMTGPAFLASLGGTENFIAPDPDPKASVPCLGDQYKQPALDAFEQEQIAVASAPAFFDAHLAETAETRQDGCRYLLHELTKNAAVTLE